MAALYLTGNSFLKEKEEYHGKFGHTFGQTQHIFIISLIGIFHTICHLGNQTVEPTLPGFQGLKRYIQYMASQPNQPIFCPTNYYDGSNGIVLTWSGNQV